MVRMMVIAMRIMIKIMRITMEKMMMMIIVIVIMM
jgi:hypothetical protein